MRKGRERTKEFGLCARIGEFGLEVSVQYSRVAAVRRSQAGEKVGKTRSSGPDR